MNEDLSFNIEKLTEVYNEMQRLHNEYKETINLLNLEIKKLETTWGSKPNSTYIEFKEKYEEKRPKLIETENMMNELLDVLNEKKGAIEGATVAATNAFE